MFFSFEFNIFYLEFLNKLDFFNNLSLFCLIFFQNEVIEKNSLREEEINSIFNPFQLIILISYFFSIFLHVLEFKRTLF